MDTIGKGEGKGAESACKPGSVRRLRVATIIPLGAPSPIRSSSLPGPDAGRAMRSLFGLAPGGVCRAGRLPDSRCALTAPFHPCHAHLAMPFGGIFLLHYPSARAAQALPGTVPCGARTFLGTLASDATVWPAPPWAFSHKWRLVWWVSADGQERTLAPIPGSGQPTSGTTVLGRIKQAHPAHT